MRGEAKLSIREGGMIGNFSFFALKKPKTYTTIAQNLQLIKLLNNLLSIVYKEHIHI